MYKDILGKTRQKVALHMHTNLSDGKKTPAEAAEIYKSAGYDAIAFTDHWHYHKAGEINGVKIISGVEYDVGGRRTQTGVFHILGLFMRRDPEVIKSTDDAQTIINKIHAVGGLAVLAHPAWSLNTPEMIMALEGFDATEIYNAVSEVEQSFRPDSSIIVDMIASKGRRYPLLATDDAHYFDGRDNCRGYIMVESETAEPEALKEAIAEGRFYASQGPEVHLLRDGDGFRVVCSPCSHVYFASNSPWCVRAKHGEGLTEARYTPLDNDLYVRAFVIDESGRTAWSNIISLD